MAYQDYFKTVCTTCKNWVSRFYPKGLIKGVFPRLMSKVKKQPLKLPAPHESMEEEVPKQYENHPCPNYMDLKMRYRDIGRLNAIIEALGRDFLTAMPEGAYKSRLGQIAFLARRLHEDLASQEVASQIEQAHAHERNNPDDWDEWDSANLHEMEIMYRHHCQVSPDLMEKRAHLSYEGRRRHKDVLMRNDWGAAQGFLQEMIDLQRTIADTKCLKENKHESDPAYQALIREYMPGVRLKEMDALFSGLKEKLDVMLPKIIAHQKQQKEPLFAKGEFPADLQLKLNKSILKVLGFDFNRGGLYETGHNPVEGGTPDDTRLVIKTSDTGNFLDSLKSALHEGGHGLYIQGLPRTQWRYQPVGQDLGAGMQESQALLAEMIIGRMPEFFQYLSPRVEGTFQRLGDETLSAENLFKLKTRVQPGLLRRQADEVTYFYHINMRQKLERDLIAGRLKVKDLPDAWNAEVKSFTGQEPANYAEGCLQDVHWFVGKFGYFPSYTLGHMMAAQIFKAMKRDIQNIPDLIRQGDFKPLLQWLGTNVHSKGRLMRTDRLMEEVTGSRLQNTALLNHFEERYLQAA